MNPIREVLYAFRKESLIVGIFSMVANLLMLMPTIYMLQVFDRVMVSQSEMTLLVVSLITAFMFGMMAFAEWSRSRVLVRAGVRLDDQLSTRVFNGVYESYLRQSKENPSRAFADLTELRQFITGNGTIAFFDTPWTPIYIAVLFLLHPFLGYMAIVFVIVHGLLALLGHSQTLAPNEKAMAAQADEMKFLQSKVRSAEVLEALGMTENLRERWLRKRLQTMRAHGASQSLSHKLAGFSKFIRYTQQSLSLGAGAYLVILGELTPGAMIAANILTTRALAPIDLLVTSWKQFISAREAFRRLEGLMIRFPNRDRALTRMAPEGAVRLASVVATAEGRQDPILKGIDYLAPAGTVTVVLGPSGSGKSTLARVVVGIWPQVAGEVLLDERPISGWDRDELGPHIGYLPQDIELFDGPIAENIARFGEVESEKVVAAAKATGLHEMILRMPRGYDTSIGEAGRILSGGQRQRIALARAVYGDPRLVVLDEPNANLDDVGEKALMQAVMLMKQQGKTIFLISHRPQVMAVADRLLILADGKVQASGPKNGVLAALTKAQEDEQAARAKANPSTQGGPDSGAAPNPA
jgi:ATP-binding cassette subfamily C exporter for protease/lipase